MPALILVVSLSVGVATGPTDDREPPPSDEWAEAHVQDSVKAQVEFATQTFPTLKVDLRSLPRTSFNASYVTESPTFQDAAKAAGVVARIAVKDVTFLASGRARVTANVTETWKGESPATIEFEQIATVEKLEDGSIYIVEADVAPLLVPGDEAVVFLSPPSKDWDDLPSMILFTGWYRVDSNGRIEVPEFAPESSVALAGGTLLDLRRAFNMAIAGQ